MQQPSTWKEDLISLHRQRKNLKGSLRYLYEQLSKTSRASVTTHNEIEDIKMRLLEIEKQIFRMQEALGSAIENEGLRKIEEFSPYIADEQSIEFDDAEDNPLPVPSAYHPSTQKKRDRYGQTWGVFAIVSVVLISVIIFVVQYKGNLTSKSQLVGDTLVYSGYYHIGDANIQQFHSPIPQPNPFFVKFSITAIGANPRLILTASHVDPNVDQSPVLIFVNNVQVDYLNSYFTEETISPKQVSIPVNVSCLKIGENELRIETRATTAEYQAANLDDFEFWDVKLQFSGE